MTSDVLGHCSFCGPRPILRISASTLGSPRCQAPAWEHLSACHMSLSFERYGFPLVQHRNHEESDEIRANATHLGLRLVQERHACRLTKSESRHLPSLHRPLVRQASLRPSDFRPRHTLALAHCLAPFVPKMYLGTQLSSRLQLRPSSGAAVPGAPYSRRPASVLRFLPSTFDSGYFLMTLIDFKMPSSTSIVLAGASAS